MEAEKLCMKYCHPIHLLAMPVLLMFLPGNNAQLLKPLHLNLSHFDDWFLVQPQIYAYVVCACSRNIILQHI